MYNWFNKTFTVLNQVFFYLHVYPVDVFKHLNCKVFKEDLLRWTSYCQMITSCQARTPYLLCTGVFSYLTFFITISGTTGSTHGKQWIYSWI